MLTVLDKEREQSLSGKVSLLISGRETSLKPKSLRLHSPANIQLKMKSVQEVHVQSTRWVAKVCFLIVPSISTKLIVVTAYIYKIVDKKCLEQELSALKEPDFRATKELKHTFIK